MKVSEFDFELPAALIAQHPASPRDSARLIEVGAALADWSVGDLPHLLKAGDLLVYNDTRVIQARLAGWRGAARVEVTLHRRLDSATWRAFARPAKRLKPGDRIEFAPGLAATVAARGEGGEVELAFAPSGDLMAALERHGSMPLPPYIRRPRGGDPRDLRDYQTMWAEKEGAVAAPTAGLHFTPALIDALERAGIARAALTLHVGAGTFLPVKVEDTEAHAMHAEWGEVSGATAAAVEAARARGGRIVAVGSTSLRLLETAADARGRVREFAGETRLFVTPGYRFKVVDLLLTNFHLPRSTLFMLVAAFAGLARMRSAYAHAIARGYRFYSYGDCCLLHRREGP
ncbi:MAG: tRNA preQ1(34) S-adenosylmethionine ribosyltransferase-isomerase QueA [Pseudomonadota bacterium]